MAKTEADTENTSQQHRPIGVFKEILLWPLQIEPNGPHWRKGLLDFLDDHDAWKPIDRYRRQESDHESSRYAEFVYFHPFVRRFLYNKGDDTQEPALHIFERTGIAKIRIHLQKNDATTVSHTLDVARLHLYIFDLPIVILVMEIGYEAGSQPGKLTLADAQDIMDTLRRAYPPYWENGKPGHCPLKVELLNSQDKALHQCDHRAQDRYEDFVHQKRLPPVAAHWKHILCPLWPKGDPLVDKKFYFRQIGDERMAVMTYLALQDPRSLRRSDFVRLAFADAAGKNLPYAKNFLHDFEQRYCYDRYWSTDHENDAYGWMTTRYLCSGYAFVMLGDAEEKAFSPTPQPVPWLTSGTTTSRWA